MTLRLTQSHLTALFAVNAAILLGLRQVGPLTNLVLALLTAYGAWGLVAMALRGRLNGTDTDTGRLLWLRLLVPTLTACYGCADLAWIDGLTRAAITSPWAGTLVVLATVPLLLVTVVAATTSVALLAGDAQVRGDNRAARASVGRSVGVSIGARKPPL